MKRKIRPPQQAKRRKKKLKHSHMKHAKAGDREANYITKILRKK